LVVDVPGGLSRYRPHLQYLLLAERGYSDGELKELNSLVAALFRLENSRSPEHLLEVVTTLLHWLSDEKQDTLRRAFTVWFRRVLFPSHFDAEHQPAIEDLGEVKNMLSERVKEWNRESMERGLQQGLQQGALQLLIGQFEKKFGELPADVVVKLNQADEEQIVLWSERILTVKTLGEIFGH